MTKVFISYARADVKDAKDLRAALLSCDIDVWMDLFDIPSGTQNWDRLIHNALRKCSHLVLIHTRNSFNSDEVWSEWRQFMAYGKTVIPLIVENVELPFRLRNVQFINFLTTPVEEAFEKLLNAILVEFPTPPDWNGSDELLPLGNLDIDNFLALSSPQNNDNIYDLVTFNKHNRVHWADEIRAKQLIQRKFVEQYTRTILNLDKDETPPPRNNLINFNLLLGHNLSHDLDCNLSPNQYALTDLLNNPAFIKSSISLERWPNGIQPSYPDDKNYLIAKYNYRLSDGQLAPESLILSRDKGKYRFKSVLYESIFTSIQLPSLYSN